MLIVKNIIESKETQVEGLKANVDRIVRERYGGDIYAYIKSLVDRIDALENEVVNKDNEIAHLTDMVVGYAGHCNVCEHNLTPMNDEPCCGCMDWSNFVCSPDNFIG